MTVVALENAPEYKNQNTHSTVLSLSDEVRKMGLELMFDDNLGDEEFMSGIPHLVVVERGVENKRIFGCIPVKRPFLKKVGLLYLGLGNVKLPAKGSGVTSDNNIYVLSQLFYQHDLEVNYIH